MDYEFDATADWRRFKFLIVIDEHVRLCLAIRLGGCCKDKDLVTVMEELTSIYPAPAFILSDNGPEFIAEALRSWCEDSATTSRPTSRRVPQGRTDARNCSMARMSSSTRSCLPRL